jgi:GntR family transcriptional regulator
VDWASISLNRASPIPLYYQLAEAVLEHIRRGDLEPGVQLPAERNLAEGVGISRMTARQAVAHLVSQGALEVRHGIGTFVAEPKLTYDPSHLRGFSEEMLRQGGAVSSTVLEQTVLHPPRAVAAALAIDPDEPVMKLVRIRSLNGAPLLLETSFVLQRQCALLEHENLQQGSLYAILADRCGIRVHHARQTIEAIVADDYESEVFSIAVGTPMLLLEGTAYDEHDAAVEYFKAVYRGDRFKFALGNHEESGSIDRSSVPLNLVLT